MINGLDECKAGVVVHKTKNGYGAQLDYPWDDCYLTGYAESTVFFRGKKAFVDYSFEGFTQKDHSTMSETEISDKVTEEDIGRPSEKHFEAALEILANNIRGLYLGNVEIFVSHKLYESPADNSTS
jgi:hypothetical protein